MPSTSPQSIYQSILYAFYLHICQVDVSLPIWCLSELGAFSWPHCLRQSHWAEIKRLTISASNLQQKGWERTTQVSILFDPPPFFHSLFLCRPGSLFRDYIRNQRDLYSRHWPCQSVWTLALLFDSQVVREKECIIIVAWGLWNMWHYSACDYFKLHISLVQLCL